MKYLKVIVVLLALVANVHCYGAVTHIHCESDSHYIVTLYDKGGNEFLKVKLCYGQSLNIGDGSAIHPCNYVHSDNLTEVYRARFSKCYNPDYELKEKDACDCMTDTAPMDIYVDTAPRVNTEPLLVEKEGEIATITIK
jgi:hypothetical protein